MVSKHLYIMYGGISATWWLPSKSISTIAFCATQGDTPSTLFLSGGLQHFPYSHWGGFFLFKTTGLNNLRGKWKQNHIVWKKIPSNLCCICLCAFGLHLSVVHVQQANTTICQKLLPDSKIPLIHRSDIAFEEKRTWHAILHLSEGYWLVWWRVQHLLVPVRGAVFVCVSGPIAVLQLWRMHNVSSM